MSTSFNIGDIVQRTPESIKYKIAEIDEISDALTRYRLVDENGGLTFTFWDYCLGWSEVVTPDKVINNGAVLADVKIGVDRTMLLLYKGEVYQVNYENDEFVKLEKFTKSLQIKS